MHSHLDYFSDLLEDGEQISSTVAGPGVPEESNEIWYQLATTRERILAIKLMKSPLGHFQPVQKMAAQKAEVHVSRFAETDPSGARLAIMVAGPDP